MKQFEARESIARKCGPGWLSLTDEIFRRVPEDVSISSIYQKWGALHFDAEPWSDEVEAIHEDIATRSLSTCEICGELGSQKTIANWIHTRCEKHAT